LIEGRSGVMKREGKREKRRKEEVAEAGEGRKEVSE